MAQKKTVEGAKEVGRIEMFGDEAKGKGDRDGREKGGPCGGQEQKDRGIHHHRSGPHHYGSGPHHYGLTLYISPFQLTHSVKSWICLFFNSFFFYLFKQQHLMVLMLLINLIYKNN